MEMLENKMNEEIEFGNHMADYWFMLRSQPREVRESYSDLYFIGLDSKQYKTYQCKLDFVNCCYEKALRYAK